MPRKTNRYVVDDNGCWIWQLYRGPCGYGRVTHESHSGLLAHRVMWEERNGPIPIGMYLDHLCRNGSGGCVNPDHLEPVTPSENTRRSSATKLNWDAVYDLRATIDSDAAAAKRFGINPSTVSRIRKYKIWRLDPS